MSCVFCGIAKKEIKSAVVHETKNVFAFDDIAPQAPTHVVVIPKEHATDIEKLDGVLPEIFGVIAEVAKMKGINGSGFRIVMNRGRNAGQAVDHLHFHVLGGRAMHWPPG
jgi:histidine triad (HIT) family protein